MQATASRADALPPLPGTKRKFNVESQYKIVNGRMIGEVCAHSYPVLVCLPYSSMHVLTEVVFRPLDAVGNIVQTDTSVTHDRGRKRSPHHDFSVAHIRAGS